MMGLSESPSRLSLRMALGSIWNQIAPRTYQAVQKACHGERAHSREWDCPHLCRQCLSLKISAPSHNSQILQRSEPLCFARPDPFFLRVSSQSPNQVNQSPALTEPAF